MAFGARSSRRSARLRVGVRRARMLTCHSHASILTSDFYGLCFGLSLFGYTPYWLYVSPASASLRGRPKLTRSPYHSLLRTLLCFSDLLYTSLSLVLRLSVSYAFQLLLPCVVRRSRETDLPSLLTDMEVVARGKQADREEAAGHKKVVGDSSF